MLLSPHFTLEELTSSEVALRHGIPNVPSATELVNLRFLSRKLEEVRAVLKNPIIVNSAYRCLPVNALVGSKPTSAHVKGLAADIVCPAFGTPKEIAQAIVLSNIQYDQVIIEFDRWVHIGFADLAKRPRLQKLVIDASGTRNFV